MNSYLHLGKFVLHHFSFFLCPLAHVFTMVEEHPGILIDVAVVAVNINSTVISESNEDANSRLTIADFLSRISHTD